MKSSNKFLAGVLLGAAVGAVLALFLKSDKGKELVDKVKEGASDLADNVKAKYDHLTKDATNNPEATS